MKGKAVFFWSGGKDSALALYNLRKEDRYEVVTLLTTCNEHFQRVSMHGVRLELLEKQAEAIGLPLQKMFVSQRSSNEEYLQRLTECLLAYKAQGITSFAFGDIFLEDLKRWREDNLAKLGLRGIFPIWKRASRDLIGEFIALGFSSVTCCVNDAYLDQSFLGRNVDTEFVNSLPPDVDPCGEKWRVPFVCVRRSNFREAAAHQGWRDGLPSARGNASGQYGFPFRLSPVCPPPHERILVLRPPSGMTDSSPCIGVCKLDAHGVCIGCFRRIEEIAAWTSMTEVQKRQVAAALANRRLTAKTGPDGKKLNE